MKSAAAFSELDQSEKINLITKTAPQILSVLKQDISTLSPEALNSLHEVSLLEKTAQGMAKKLSQQLFKVVAGFAGPVKKKIDELNLTDEKKDVVNSIYKQTILVTIQRSADNVYQDLKKQEGKLYSALLSETVVNIMDSILDFKKKIDKTFPGLSDKIIAAAVPAITAAVSAYSLPLGLVLKSTGALDRAAGFLKTENLEKTIDKMRSDLVEIKNDKQLADAQEAGVKIAELAEQIDVSPVSLSKLSLDSKGVTKMMKEVTNNSEARELLQDVCKYAEKNLPNSETQVDANFEAVKEATLKELQQLGASPDTLKEVSAILDESIAQAKEEMQNALKPDTKIFDKITAVQQSADVMNKASNKIAAVVNANHPENQQLTGNALKVVKQKTDKIIRGDVSKVAKHLTSQRAAKQFAKETLGAGLANEMALKRALPSKGVSLER